MEARWERHRRLARRTAEWAGAHGVSFASEAGFRSPTVSCLQVPGGWDGPGLVAALAERGSTVGGGYGRWKPSTFRIGHMGEVHDGDLEALLDHLGALLEARTDTSR